MSEMRIRKIDGGAVVDLEAGDAVASINYIGSTFIRNIKVSINGREISDSNSLYMFKSYLDAELSLPKSSKETYLSAAGYYTDGNDQQDAAANPGFTSRQALFQRSRTAQFISKLDVDLFNQPNYMIGGVEIEIEITPNDSAFCVLEPANTNNLIFVFEITSLRLYVKNLELMSGLAYDLSQKLEKTPARYALRRTSMFSHHISAGRTEFSTLLFSEQVPRRIVVGLLSSTRYDGRKHLSPFNFQPHGVRELTIFANGRTYPSNLYNLDYRDTHNLYTRAFHDTCEALGFANSVESNGIDIHKFKNGWCLYVFNLTNSGEDNPCFDLVTDGSCNINIKFRAQVPAEGLTLIALAERDSLLMIDRNRTVVADYHA
jgi:hypothetical protein